MYPHSTASADLDLASVFRFEVLQRDDLWVIWPSFHSGHAHFSPAHELVAVLSSDMDREFLLRVVDRIRSGDGLSPMAEDDAQPPNTYDEVAELLGVPSWQSLLDDDQLVYFAIERYALRDYGIIEYLANFDSSHGNGSRWAAGDQPDATILPEGTTDIEALDSLLALVQERIAAISN